MEKFRKYRFADVGKSKLGKKIKNETCAKHKIDRSQNGRSKKRDQNKKTLKNVFYIYGLFKITPHPCSTASVYRWLYSMSGVGPWIRPWTAHRAPDVGGAECACIGHVRSVRTYDVYDVARLLTVSRATDSDVVHGFLRPFNHAKQLPSMTRAPSLPASLHVGTSSPLFWRGNSRNRPISFCQTPLCTSFTSSSRTASTDFCPNRFFWATRFLILFFPYFFRFRAVR